MRDGKNLEPKEGGKYPARVNFRGIFMKNCRFLQIGLVCLMVCLLSGCGRTKNELPVDLGAEPYSLSVYSYNEGNGKIYSTNDTAVAGKILEDIATGKAKKAEDWTHEQLTYPIYGVDATDSTGEEIEIAWSNGYWITNEGAAYQGGFDFEKVIADNQWYAYDFTFTSMLPCRKMLCLGEDGWLPWLLIPAREETAPEGISMAIIGQDDSKLTIEMTNRSRQEWAYGEGYSVQVCLDDVWYILPEMPGAWYVRAIAIVLPAGETREEICSFDRYGALPAGKYRLVKEGMTAEFECPVNQELIQPEGITKATEKQGTEGAANLKELFAEHEMKAGTCLSEAMLEDENCLRIIKENFNSITLENDMKPDYTLDKEASVAAGEIVVSFSDTAKKLLDWCRDNDMALRGHTLVWYSQTPDWIFYEKFDTNGALVSREVMLERMDSYIRQVFELLEKQGYSDMIYAYDVVNEAWMEDGRMRDNLWRETIGDDYMWYAFYYADKYAPEHIDLYYNDYNEHLKWNTIYDFVQTLVDENGDYLIDGIGMQAHLYTGDYLPGYLGAVEKLGATGLKVNLTELDVSLGTWDNIRPATEENLEKQGQYYYDLIGGLFQLADEGKVEMDALTFWGFADHLSWRSDRSPLLFNAQYEPKPAYYGALQWEK